MLNQSTVLYTYPGKSQYLIAEVEDQMIGSIIPVCYERQHHNSTRTTNTTLTHFCQDIVQSGNRNADLLTPQKPHGERRSCTLLNHKGKLKIIIPI